MKPRFILTTVLLSMVMLYLPVDAAYETIRTTTTPTEPIEVKSHLMHMNQQPVQPASPEEKKAMRNTHENPKTAGKGAHAEEDGKHHHFHMDRVKRMKRFVNIFTLLTKCFLAITHICILVGVFKALVH